MYSLLARPLIVLLWAAFTNPGSDFLSHKPWDIECYKCIQHHILHAVKNAYSYKDDSYPVLMEIAQV